MQFRIDTRKSFIVDGEDMATKVSELEADSYEIVRVVIHIPQEQ